MAEGREHDGSGGHRGGPRGRGGNDRGRGGGRGGRGGGRGGRGGGRGGRDNRGGRGGGRPHGDRQDPVLQAVGQLTETMQQQQQAVTQLTQTVQQQQQQQQEQQHQQQQYQQQQRQLLGWMQPPGYGTQPMGYGAQPMGYGAQPMGYPGYGPPQPWSYPPQPAPYYPPQPQWGYGQGLPGAYPPWTTMLMAQGLAGTTVAPTPVVLPYQMAPTYQAPAQFTQTQAQDVHPAAPETPEPTRSQGRTGRSYRVRKRKRNPPRRRPTGMERDESTSQRFSQSPEMGDEADFAEAAGERQTKEAEEEAEAREAAIEKVRQERISAQQHGRTQLEGSWRSIIAGIDQETFDIARANCDVNRFPSNNENLQHGLASLLPRIWRFRRFVTTCLHEVGESLDQNSDPAELTEALDQLLEMVSSYWQEHVAPYRKDANRFSAKYTRLLNSNSG